MRRPRRRLEVSTFPFLAVLLCAMGSLILLLLVLDRRAKAAARAKAQEVAREALAERGAAARAAAEAAARRTEERAAESERQRTALREQLTRAKDEVAAQLKTVEGRKSDAARGAAAQAQRWRELLEVLSSRREELANAERETATSRAAAAQDGEMSESARKEAARLSARLRGLEMVLDELKASRKRDAQTYSLLPYRGKRGDGRRPLYVECGADGIVFHPDRKALARIATAQEIRNEVDARVERQRQGVLAQGGQPEKRPYLLMLVRPNGIGTYYATLGALKGKEIDFGYEFIDADWVLDFPEGDAAPAAQPWMTAQRIAVAPADPSAPTRKVTGLRAGRTADDEFSEGGAEGTGTKPGSDPARGGSSDLPPLPGAAAGVGAVGGGPGQTGGRTMPGGSAPGVAWTPVGSGMGGAAGGSGLPPLPDAPVGSGVGGSASGSSAGGALMPGGSRPGAGASSQPGGSSIPGGVSLGVGGSGRPGVPNPDGALPGNPTSAPGGGSGSDQAGGTPGGAPGTAGGTTGISGVGGAGSGPPALFPFDRAAQPRGGSGGSSRGGAGSGQGNGPPGNGQPGSTSGGQPSAGGAGGAPGSVQTGGGKSPAGGESVGTAAGGPSGGSPMGGSQPPAGASTGQADGTPGSGQAGGAGSPGGGGESAGDGAGGQSSGSPTGGSAGESGSTPAKGARSGAVGDEAPGAGPPRGSTSGGPSALGGGGGPPAPAGAAGGGQPLDPDEPQGPNLGAGLLPGGERRPSAAPPRPMRLIGNRDWVIPVECRADSVVLRNAGQKFAPPNAGGDNPLLRSLRQTIARRQASVRPGEPPFRPQVRFLIYPDGLKTYYLTLSALEPLGIPLTRQNVEADPSPRPAP